MLPGGHAPLHMQHRIHRRLSHPRHVLTVWEPRPVQPDPAREKSPDEVRLQGPREPKQLPDPRHCCQQYRGAEEAGGYRTPMVVTPRMGKQPIRILQPQAPPARRA
jgi:hypothetical protein